jgi:formylglycine-generating enzyme required for sulfatase activity
VWNDGDDFPLVNVTWEEMRDFCAWSGGRLPTEAEWEYAARAGGSAVYPWGDRFDPNQANGLGVAGADSWKETAPVGSFPPNGYGLFDMTGNVWEWVADWYWRRYYALSPDLDPIWSKEGTERVMRGGSWDSTPPGLRASFRFRRSPTGRYNLYIGGRCARDES